MENKNIDITILEINERSFATKPLPEIDKAYILGENLHIVIGYAIDIKVDNELITFKLIIKYYTDDEHSPLMEYTFDSVFNVTSIDELVTHIDDTTFEIEDGFVKTLAGVCIGTARGLISAKTQGTEWKKYPLPIINVNELVEDSQE